MRSNENIKRIYLHSSDSPHRGDTAADVHRWHKERGWDGIGYHHTIDEYGNRENGRPHYWEGAHCYGDNDSTIGVMLFGNGDFTEVQITETFSLLFELLKKYPDADIVEHRYTDKGKTCPQFGPELQKRFIGVFGSRYKGLTFT